MLNVPVAFLIFNRPEHTRKVFKEIAQAKPRKLLVIADGPRSKVETDKCTATRAVIDELDWDCELITNYSEKNLGCKLRVSSGLNWVFDQCKEAIILEDDCLPHPGFFQFSSELLEKYRDDNRVMMIGGSNFQFGRKRGEFSYYFSRYAQVWGWASWRRAWKLYDIEMTRWPELQKTGWLKNSLNYNKAAKHWHKIFDYNYQGLQDSWDIQWVFTCLVNNGLTLLPNTNLVSNIGFGENATHTKSDIYGVASLSTMGIDFPLSHPSLVIPDNAADKFTFDNLFAREAEQPTFYRRFGRKIAAYLPEYLRNSISDLRSKQG